MSPSLPSREQHLSAAMCSLRTSGRNKPLAMVKAMVKVQVHPSIPGKKKVFQLTCSLARMLAFLEFEE